MVLDKYLHLKEELVKCIDSSVTIESITGDIRDRLTKLREDLTTS